LDLASLRKKDIASEWGSRAHDLSGLGTDHRGAEYAVFISPGEHFYESPASSIIPVLRTLLVARFETRTRIVCREITRRHGLM
jgi:hypothetical protein